MIEFSSIVFCWTLLENLKCVLWEFIFEKFTEPQCPQKQPYMKFTLPYHFLPIMNLPCWLLQIANEGRSIEIASFLLGTMLHIIPHKIRSANTQTDTDSLMYSVTMTKSTHNLTPPRTHKYTCCGGETAGVMTC